MLVVELRGETQRILGEMCFSCRGIKTFKYWAEARLTKFMYICAGIEGLDNLLLEKGRMWESVFYFEVCGEVRMRDGWWNVRVLGEIVSDLLFARLGWKDKAACCS